MLFEDKVDALPPVGWKPEMLKFGTASPEGIDTLVSPKSAAITFAGRLNVVHVWFPSKPARTSFNKLAEMMKKNAESSKEKKTKKKVPKNGQDPDYLTQPAMKEAANILTDLVAEEQKEVTVANKSETDSKSN